MLGYLVVVGLSCVTTATTALFCSTVFQKSSTSLISTYLIIGVMYMAPVAMAFFAETFFGGTVGAQVVDSLGVLSPFSAVFALPLEIEDVSTGASADLPQFFGYFGWSLLYNAALVAAMMRLFQVRWRVAD
jgi:hypothetical protein